MRAGATPGACGQTHTAANVARHWRRMNTAQRSAALVAAILSGLFLHALSTAHTYDGRIVPYFRTRQLYYERLYKTNGYYSGRSSEVHPSPRCCVAEDCLQRGCGQRHAVVSALRTDAYLPMLRELACSLAVSNPGLPLVVLTAAGELAPATKLAVESFAELRVVEPLFFESISSLRFGLNWMKLRLWELEDLDALLYMDADSEVLGDISGVFSLPTDFAAVLDANKKGYSYASLGRGQAGVLFVRPCAAVAAHMLALASENTMLQFPLHDAEQDFFNWYFLETRMLLPQEYNALSDHVHWRPANRTVSIAQLQPSVVASAAAAISGDTRPVGVRPVVRKGVRQLAFTRGGALVKILHHAVENKPWHHSSCQESSSLS